MKKGNIKIGSVFVRLFVSAVLIFLLFYTMLPAVNFRDRNFLIFLIISIILILLVNMPTYVKQFFESLNQGHGEVIGQNPVTGAPIYAKRPWRMASTKISRPLKIGFGLIFILLVWMAIATVIGQRIFNASRYRDLIVMTDGDFAQDVAELQMSQIPVVDKDTASRLGSRKLGEMTELVSQFEIENNYTQINYKGTPYRVTPLAYADPIKWFYNMRKGLPAYIAVDMVTQETDLVWLENGMKYSTSEYFFRNIYRYLRFSYPTRIFENISFEIDDDGVPYWVAPVVQYRIGWWDGKDISGAILVNAITGESQYYEKEDVPEWIDQLYTSDLIIEQLDDNGKFQNGFINSIFGQRNVRRTTYGYNYLAIHDDVYLYTGMSSVTADESNIGFVLVNLRTKETKFYVVPGATEYSAMGSAQGQVQHLQYTATFPLLLNISGRPAYFVSLKDAAGLVKMYAFVDVAQYQIVGTGATVDEAKKNYRLALNMEEIEMGTPLEEQMAKGTVEAIADVVISGNTQYYFTLRGQDAVYAADISIYEKLPFLKAGDMVEFTYQEPEGSTVKVVTGFSEE
ncbi:MAG: CvpA family protein [bacterium]|nr:CvpA family protein [bacterium]